MSRDESVRREGAAAGEPERFELSIPVLPEDIDTNGHVNNVVYLRWVQDAATAHWNARTSDAEKRASAWVAVVDERSSARVKASRASR